MKACAFLSQAFHKIKSSGDGALDISPKSNSQELISLESVPPNRLLDVDSRLELVHHFD